MHGYMVEILDLFTNHIRKQEFIDKIKNAHPDMIGISAYTENINAVTDLLMEGCLCIYRLLVFYLCCLEWKKLI